MSRANSALSLVLVNAVTGQVVSMSGKPCQLNQAQRLIVSVLSLRRTADLLLPEVELHVDMVGDADKRNAFVHPVILAVEDHCSFDLVCASPLPGNR